MKIYIRTEFEIGDNYTVEHSTTGDQDEMSAADWKDER
jgi:hypothetical protein